MEKKRKLRGKWLAALGALLMAVALWMLHVEPSVLQYAATAPAQTGIATAGTASTGTEGAQAVQGAQTDQDAQAQPDAEGSSALSQLAASWEKAAGDALGEVVSATAISARDYGFSLSSDAGSMTLTLAAVGPGYFDVYPRYLVAGRLPTADELERGERVAVLDEPAAFKLFPTSDPLEGRVRIGEAWYDVVGVARWSRDVGRYEQHQAYIPFACAARDDLPMEVVEVCARPLPRSGASRVFEESANTWLPGGTFVDTAKESMRASIAARAVAVALAVYALLYLARMLTRRAGALISDVRGRLRTTYMRDMLPWLLPRAALQALCAALLIAAFYGVLTVAIEPMYVFTEWIPDVLVELSSITERFWQLTSAAAKPVRVYTEAYARIRFWAGVLRWGLIALFTGALVMALSSRPPRAKVEARLED